jgi:hypothetical protein
MHRVLLMFNLYLKKHVGDSFIRYKYWGVCLMYVVCVCLSIVVFNTYCVVFLFCFFVFFGFFVLCTLCCQLLWIFNYWNLQFLNNNERFSTPNVWYLSWTLISLNQILESRDWAYDAKQSSIKLGHEIPYVYPMLPASLDFPYLIATSIFSNVYFLWYDSLGLSNKIVDILFSAHGAFLEFL